MSSKISYFTVPHYNKLGDEILNFAVWDKINEFLEKEDISSEDVINVSEHDGYTRVFYRVPDGNTFSLGNIV